MTAALLQDARKIAGDLALDLSSDIHACEEALSARLGSHVCTVAQISSHVAGSGGKRLRPLFVSLAARATGRDYIAERLKQLSACMEMIHMATLIHDDVVDGATTRRGRETASVLWGNAASILTGDVLLAKAMEILAEDGDLRIIRTVSSSVVEMAEGEVMEVQTRGDFELDAGVHVEILRKKTAAFIATCCQVGAQVAGADPSTEFALKEYGEAAGIAFQIADDLLDFRGDPTSTGKPNGTDFREGCATLPLILLRDSISDSDRDFLKSRFGNGVTESDLQVISKWMDERNAFAQSYRIAGEYVQSAHNALNALPPSKARDILRSLAVVLATREA